jgi:hypothetical protein
MSLFVFTELSGRSLVYITLTLAPIVMNKNKKWISQSGEEDKKEFVATPMVHQLLIHLNECVSLLEQHLGLPSEQEDSMVHHDTDVSDHGYDDS